MLDPLVKLHSMMNRFNPFGIQLTRGGQSGGQRGGGYDNQGFWRPPPLPPQYLQYQQRMLQWGQDGRLPGNQTTEEAQALDAFWRRYREIRRVRDDEFQLLHKRNPIRRLYGAGRFRMGTNRYPVGPGRVEVTDPEELFELVLERERQGVQTIEDVELNQQQRQRPRQRQRQQQQEEEEEEEEEE